MPANQVSWCERVSLNIDDSVIHVDGNCFMKIYEK